MEEVSIIMRHNMEIIQITILPLEEMSIKTKHNMVILKITIPHSGEIPIIIILHMEEILITMKHNMGENRILIILFTGETITKPNMEEILTLTIL